MKIEIDVAPHLIFTVADNMDKRLNKKCQNFITTFKNAIKGQIGTTDLSTETGRLELLQYVMDYPGLVITKEDIEKRKRVKNNVPYCERCGALRADSNQCTRRRKEGSRFCGTHLKGIPHGEVSAEATADQHEKVQVWAQDIKGIVYYIDANSNVYNPMDIHQNKVDPRVLAKYHVEEDGSYSIPSLF
jgi:hypothetical protein